MPLLLPLLASDPDDAMARFLMGVARLGQGRLAEARQHLRRADQVEPDDPATLSLLARLAYDLEGPRQALVLLKRVVVLQPDDPGHWTNLGLVNLDLGDLGEAHDAFLRALRLDSRHAAAHRGLGRFYALVGQPALAETSWRTALQIEPDEGSAWLALGHVLREQGRLEDALSAYRRGRQLLPHESRATANVGSVLVAMGRCGEARELLLSALAGMEREPKDQARCLSDLGTCLAAGGDLDGAEQSFREALDRVPEMGETRAELGALLLDRGQDRDAERQLQQAWQQDALSPALIFELVLLHQRTGDAAAARRCALDLFAPSSDPVLLWNRARLQLASEDDALHDPAAAEVLLTELLSGPLSHSGEGWALLAVARQQRGELNAALEALDQALLVGADAPGRMGWRERREELRKQLTER